MAAGWQWLVKPERGYSWGFVGRVVVRALLLFALVNIVYAVAQPLPLINRISPHNTLIAGRDRLPYADNPDEVFNLSLTQLDGMFAVHEIEGARKAADEFRVLVLGDSGVWGWLLDNDETLSACLNRGSHRLPDGRRLVTYNLGYPITNVTKDVMLLDYALRYAPDAIVWLTTLEGLYDDDQLTHPVVQDNRERVLRLIEDHGLSLDTAMLPPEPNLWEQTLVGQRRALADWLRLQLYGIAWAISGYDHRNPRFFRAPVANFPDSEGIPNRPEINRENLAEFLALDVIAAGMRLADANGLPVLLVNEPIFIGDGTNSDLRYNDLYPRWTYDGYRALLGDLVIENGWRYMDLWDAVPAAQFTDFPLHFNAEWTCRIAEQLAPEVLVLGS